MQLNFCTYFDKNYLFKGLALYASLARTCKDFTLWVLCFDDTTYSLLERMDLAGMKLISLSDFEDPELLSVKHTRTAIEYYFTCTPSLPLYILDREPSIKTITYLDADLYFFSHPGPLYDEFDGSSILITEHRFEKNRRVNERKWGKYNVQFLIFNNDEEARRCLTWWRERCIEWCYRRHEGDRFADQKYLNEWPSMFEGVRVMEYRGAGLGLWNVGGFPVTKEGERLRVDGDRLIFYHFHHFEILDGDRFILSNGYPLSSQVIETVYRPYIEEIRRTIALVGEVDERFDHGIFRYKYGYYKNDNLVEWSKYLVKRIFGRLIDKPVILYRA